MLFDGWLLYTPMYEIGIKPTENKPKETTRIKPRSCLIKSQKADLPRNIFPFVYDAVFSCPSHMICRIVELVCNILKKSQSL